jgi:hypothetical protein
MINQGRVVRFDEQVEKCLLGLMAFVGNVAKAILQRENIELEKCSPVSYFFLSASSRN